jgi:hypothetical protein
MYRMSAESLSVGLLTALCLWPVAAAAQAGPSLTVEQVRASFVAAGFQVGPVHRWIWTSPPVTTSQIFDRANGRVLMALVYPDAAAAQAERLQAQAREPAPTGLSLPGYGPHLVPGYGQSLWRTNVALIQTTQSDLDSIYRGQNARDNGVLVDTVGVSDPGPPNYAVDFDFQQALESGAVSL